MRRMTPTAVSRIVLLGPAGRSDEESKIRRYRLARLKLEGNDRLEGPARYAHLKRLYD
jgi:hypothetical protein